VYRRKGSPPAIANRPVRDLRTKRGRYINSIGARDLDEADRERRKRRVARIYEAFRVVVAEYEREPPRPPVLSFPNSEWRVDSIGPWEVIYKRPETARALAALTETIDKQSEAWADRYSKKHLQQIFRGTLGQAYYEQLSEGDAIELLRLAAISLDEPPHEWVAYYPVEGVFFAGELAFANIRCFRMIDAEFENLVKTYQDGIDSTIGSDERKAQLREVWDRNVSQLCGLSCIEVRTSGGDDAFLREAADRALERATDLLQLTIDVTGASPRTVLRGNLLPQAVPPRVMFRIDGEAAQLYNDLKHTHRANLSSENLEKLCDKGFGPVLDALSEPHAKLSKIQQALLNSMHWIADSRRQANRENRITSAVTAIEIFFVTDGNAPIAREVSEGVAWILGDNLEQRKHLRKLMSDLYGRRSKVSHVGLRNIDEGEEREVYRVAVSVLVQMCRLSATFKTQEEIRNWLADCRLSGASRFPGTGADNKSAI